jgi:hypothetical protein
MELQIERVVDGGVGGQEEVDGTFKATLITYPKVQRERISICFCCIFYPKFALIMPRKLALIVCLDSAQPAFGARSSSSGTRLGFTSFMVSAHRSETRNPCSIPLRSFCSFYGFWDL